jgi:L-fuculose-phosphate aldolase
MHFDLFHPADQIMMIMERIYGYGMTTTSGGNLSILDDNGDIWITPAGVDKGALTRQDIVCVKADGTVVGIHRPSSEFPFHKLIYRRRPDLKAVVHAHPPALVAFSIVRRTPNVHILPSDIPIYGEIGMAEYALPGSEQLGENIAKVFDRGLNAVMLENHGVVVGGESLFEAFKVFETLDFCARLEIKARRIGKPISLTPDQVNQPPMPMKPMPEFTPERYSSQEREARREMVKLIQRAYDQRLFTSTQGTFSQRLDDQSFIITPARKDRKYLDESDIVRIENGACEEGKQPSRSVEFHEWVYRTQPHIHSIIIAHPPNIMAFAVTDTGFDSRTIPESYILLRNAPRIAYSQVVHEPELAAQLFITENPIAIVNNDCVIVTGNSLLNAFDRLEVAEYSAKAIISAACIGDIVHIDEARIKEIDVAFKL